jgi:hypothetical protein
MAEADVVFRRNDKCEVVELSWNWKLQKFWPTVSAKIGSVHLDAGTAAGKNNLQ